MQSSFVIFASWRVDTVSNCDRFVLQFRPKFYLLFTSTRLSLNQISLGLPQHHAKYCGFVSTEAIFLQGISHNMRHNSQPHIVVVLSEQNIRQVFYVTNSLFRIEQLPMLFSAQNALC